MPLEKAKAACSVFRVIGKLSILFALMTPETCLPNQVAVPAPLPFLPCLQLDNAHFGDLAPLDDVPICLAELVLIPYHR
jgi:hypothetical protein